MNSLDRLFLYGLGICMFAAICLATWLYGANWQPLDAEPDPVKPYHFVGSAKKVPSPDHFRKVTKLNSSVQKCYPDDWGCDLGNAYYAGWRPSVHKATGPSMASAK